MTTRARRIVIADGTKFVAETDERFDVIMVDSTDPIGPGAVLFTREFYADCRRCLEPGGVLVTQNGLPFLQAGELKQSVGYFRELFERRLRLSRHHAELFRRADVLWLGDRRYQAQASPRRSIEHRYEKAGCFPTRYWRPDVHVAAFALPNYVRELVEG